MHIAGENFTEATVAIAHNHLLLVDLLYGCHDGVGLFDLSKELFLKGRTVHLFPVGVLMLLSRRGGVDQLAAVPLAAAVQAPQPQW